MIHAPWSLSVVCQWVVPLIPLGLQGRFPSSDNGFAPRALRPISANEPLGTKWSVLRSSRVLNAEY